MSPSPITLAIELSQKEGSISICNCSGIVVSRTVMMGRRDEDQVMQCIAAASEELGLTPKDLELVIVSIGPGGFTGLRTAIAIAKMISFACGVTIVPVETAIVAASKAEKHDAPVLVVSSVKQNDFWLSNVQFQHRTWVSSSQLVSADMLAGHISGVEYVITDSFLPENAKLFFEQSAIQRIDFSVDATTLLKVGLQMHEQGVQIEPANLLPIYPREPEAVRKWNAVHRPNS